MDRMLSASRTDCGRVRSRNEDALQVVPEQGWAVLADGMGGHPGGDVASRLAVAAVVHRLFADGRGVDEPAVMEQVLRRAVHEANEALLREGRRLPVLAGMGSTLVVAAFLPGCVLSAHVGDSRLYRYSARTLSQLTRDHTLLQERIDAGMIAADSTSFSSLGSILTRGLGAGLVVEPSVACHPLAGGDRFMLCSDGLSDLVDDAVIGRILGEAPTLDAAADLLVARAIEEGGTDNVSLILMQPLATGGR
jgi:protein phosphatase